MAQGISFLLIVRKMLNEYIKKAKENPFQNYGLAKQIFTKLAIKRKVPNLEIARQQ
jgi:hypothetical protein